MADEIMDAVMKGIRKQIDRLEPVPAPPVVRPQPVIPTPLADDEDDYLFAVYPDKVNIFHAKHPFWVNKDHKRAQHELFDLLRK